MQARELNRHPPTTKKRAAFFSVIEYIDTPADIRYKHQYFTQAEMDKLRAIGYSKPFTGLEEGVKEYVEALQKREG